MEGRLNIRHSKSHGTSRTIVHASRAGADSDGSARRKTIHDVGHVPAIYPGPGHPSAAPGRI